MVFISVVSFVAETTMNALQLAMNVIDSQHTDPDYSVAYVVLETDTEAALKGYGLTFTVGRGTEIGELPKIQPLYKY